MNEIAVLEPKELTKHIQNVNLQRLPKYWEVDYIHAKLAECQHPKYKMLLQFLWYTGTRITEAISVHKENIDFKNYTIKIRWLKSRKYYERIIPMHPQIKDLLFLFTASLNNTDKVFPYSRQFAWKTVCKYMGGHPHQFRHSFAVNWLRNGGDIVSLSRMLGHKNIRNTMEYLKIVPNDIGKELIKIPF